MSSLDKGLSLFCLFWAHWCYPTSLLVVARMMTILDAVNVRGDVRLAVKEPVAIHVMIHARLLHREMVVARIVLVGVQNHVQELVPQSVH